MRTRNPHHRSTLAGTLVAATFSAALGTGCVVESEPPVLRPTAEAVRTLWSTAANLVVQEDAPLDFSLEVTSAPGVPLDGAVFYIDRLPVYGRLEATAGGFRYTPDADFSGNDSLRFHGVVAGAAALPAEIVLQVTPVNDAPTMQAVTLYTDQGIPVSGQLPATDPEGDALTFRVVLPSGDGDVVLDDATGAFTFTPDAGFAGVAQIAFAASDGRLESDPAIVTIDVLDRSGPDLTAVSVGGGGLLAERHPVTLTVSAGSDAETMRVYGDLVTPTGWVAFSASRIITLTPGDGPKVIWVEVRDDLENTAGPVTGWALYDGNGPTATLTMDRLYTNEVTVGATLTWTDYSGVDGMSVGCAGSPAAWPAPVASTDVTLADADGEQVVEVCFIDGIGNVSSVTETVVLDRVAPAGALTMPTDRTATAAISVTVTTSDALSPVTAVRIDGDVATSPWVAPTSPRTVALSAGDGEKTLDLWVADAAGNVGGPFSAAITLDTTGPIILITDGPRPITTATSANFALAALDAGPVDLWCREDGGAPVACADPYAWAGTIAAGANYALTVTAIDDLGNQANGGLGRTWTWTVVDDDLACDGLALYASDLTAGAPQPFTEAPWSVAADATLGDFALLANTVSVADAQVTATASIPAGCDVGGRMAVAFHARFRAELGGSGDRLRIELANADSGRTVTLLDLVGPRTATDVVSFGRGITDVAAGDALTLRIRLDATGSADVGITDLRLERVATPTPTSFWKAAETLLVAPRVLDIDPGTAGLEVLVARGEGTTGWAQPWPLGAGAAPDPQAGVSLAQSPVGSFALGDMNGDGPPEVLIAGSTALTTISPQMGLSVYTNALPAREGPAPGVGEPDGATPVMADLDDDGLLDALVGGSLVGNSQLVAFSWGGDATGPVEIWRVAFGGGGEIPDPAVLDIDGDGASEVLVTTGLPGFLTPNRALRILRGSDGETLASIPLGNAVEGLAFAPAIGDLDNDGLYEVVWISNNGNLRADTLGPGPATVTPKWSRTADSALATPAQAPVLGDLDGDGEPEVIQALANGQVLILDGATGTLEGWFAVADGVQAEWTAGPIVGDVSGDGTPDLLLGASDGRLWIVDGLLRATWSAPVGALQATGPSPMSAAPTIADVDGDGFLDVVATTADGWILHWPMAGAAPGNLPWPMWRRDYGATAQLP